MRWLLLSAAVLLSACNVERIAQLEKQNKELAAKLEAVTKQTSLDLQERCAKQARAEFKAGDNEKEPMSFTNHYSAKLDKCFIEVTSSADSGNVPNTHRIVSDAFEGKVYAEYHWRNDTGKKYWEVEPFMCRVVLQTGEETFCKTTAEYEALIKQYMQQ